MLRAEKILDAVRDILGPVTIEELPIPYTAVATDLLAGKSVWFQRGPLDEAIRASIAIPGVIAPHEIDGRLLADGGILDPLPMAPIAAVNADLTIAVSLNGSEPGATPRRGAGRHRRMVEPHGAQHHRALDTSAAKAAVGPAHGPSGAEPVRRDDSGSEDDRTGPPTSNARRPGRRHGNARVPKLGSFEVMNRTIDIAQSALARHTLAAYPPDLLIEVPRSTCRSLEFHRAVEVIEAGRRAGHPRPGCLREPEIGRRRAAAAAIEG